MALISRSPKQAKSALKNNNVISAKEEEAELMGTKFIQTSKI